jgi:conjugal transfer pilus assembly protein TraW
MRLHVPLLLVAASVFLARPALAVDLGTLGKTYTIAEPDFLDEIQSIAQRKVADGSWKRIEIDARNRAKQAIENPPAVDGLHTVTQDRVWHFDPSIVLSQDIHDAEGHVLFPAGTTVNPADIAGFPGQLLYLDGRDTRQIALARRLERQYGDSLKLILVAGSPTELMRKGNRRVYFDQGGAGVKRFLLSAVPALISQSRPSDRYLTIQELRP